MASKGSWFHFQTLLLCILSLSAWAEIAVRKCFRGTQEEPHGEVTLSCPAGSVISVSEALLGRNKWFQCVLTEGDCMHYTKIFGVCEGLNSCTESFRTYSARCGYITILLISYTCIPVILPTVPVNNTTTPVTDGNTGGHSVGIGEDDDATGDENKKSWNPYKKEESDDEDESEVGLLVATICASLVTGVMLIIAIIMTIRRILNYPTWLQRRNRDSSSRWETCMERACFQVDKFPCFSGPDSPEGSPEQALRSQNKSVCAPLSADEPVPNIQRTRMTPIGQESSDSDVIVQPKNIVNRDEDPEGSDIAEHAQSPDTIEVGVTRSSLKKKERSQPLDLVDVCANHNSNVYSVVDDFENTRAKTALETLNNNVMKYSCRNDGEYSNKSVNFNEKDSFQSCEMDLDKPRDEAYNSNNGICKDMYQNFVLDNEVKSTGVKKCRNNDKKETDFTTIKATYSAIVVPNTETSSRC